MKNNDWNCGIILKIGITKTCEGMDLVIINFSLRIESRNAVLNALKFPEICACVLLFSPTAHAHLVCVK